MAVSANGEVSTGLKAVAGILVPAAITTIFNVAAVFIIAGANLHERLLAIQPIGTVTEQAARNGLWNSLSYLMLCACIVLVGLLLFGSLLLVLLIRKGESRWLSAHQ